MRRRPTLGLWGVALGLILASCDKKDDSKAPEALPPAPAAEAPEASPAATDANDGDEPPGEGPPEGDEGDAAKTPEAVRSSIAELRQEMVAKQREAAERALQANKSDADLKALRAEIDKRLAGVDDYQRRLEQQLGIGKVARERRDERIAALAGLLSTMTPQAGAEILAQMTDEDANWLLLWMQRRSERKAAKLMSLMPPERAAQLGQMYLNQDPDSVMATHDSTPDQIPAPAPPGAEPPRAATPPASAPAPASAPDPTKSAPPDGNGAPPPSGPPPATHDPQAGSR